MSSSPQLFVLQSHRLEDLAQALWQWQAENPLPPLQEELVLVPSHGVGSWFKQHRARQQGIYAHTRLDLPARFAWQVYARVLPELRLCVEPPLNKLQMSWRLLRLFQDGLPDEGDALLRNILAQGSDLDAWHLAQRIADLFDQYQIYRADWLLDWQEGRDVLRDARGQARPLSVEQGWQARLWRLLVDDLASTEQSSLRPQIHRQAIQALSAASHPPKLDHARVSFFAANALAPDLLDVLQALSRHIPVVIAAFNPCRYHWADIIDGRELWASLRKKSPLADVPLAQMHQHAHPLLMAWGRFGRDFMRQLDHAEELLSLQDGEVVRLSLFDEAPGQSLLQQVQAAIRDMRPLSEHAGVKVAADDRSLSFHTAEHSLREVEVLHDHLLQLLESGTLQPRDIIVMSPDISAMAAAIHAVFNLYPEDDARHIPFAIADLPVRYSQPMLLALDMLLSVGQRRWTASELCDLLDVPAIARALQLSVSEKDQLLVWLQEAGLRWGFDAEHRESLGLGAGGEQNSWDFALQRMLLGYAQGDGPIYAGRAPYAEVAGLEAAAVGGLARLLDILRAWWRFARVAHDIDAWRIQAQQLLGDLLQAEEDSEHALLQQMLAALDFACTQLHRARYEQALSLPLLAEAWWSGLQENEGQQRFLSGGVTFCNFMPLRSVPFKVVCLLGMNEQAYPRPLQRQDQDLMAGPGQQRPGDRSRLADDRYLMLEALMCARERFYLSWSAPLGTVSPPSLLITQLRDYLRQGWQGEAGGDVCEQLTHRHPLQPFSRKYFSVGGETSYAYEWRQLYLPPPEPTASIAPAAAAAASVDLLQLQALLKNPVRTYLREVLHIDQRENIHTVVADDEKFVLDNFDRYQLLNELLADSLTFMPAPAAIETVLAQRAGRILLQGSLPWAEAGQEYLQQELQTASRMLQTAWAYAQGPEKIRSLHHAWQGGSIDVEVSCREDVFVQMSASALQDRNGAWRLDKFFQIWLIQVLAAAQRTPVSALLIGRDVSVRIPAIDDTASCTAYLATLFAAWRESRSRPLPWAARTALVWVREVEDPGKKARLCYEGSFQSPGEGQEPGLQRLYPDFASLCANGEFMRYAQELFAPMLEWEAGFQLISGPGESS